jgi:hypothetical protein
MFLGEVDDLLAAAEYLAAQEFVDPGGSTSAATAPEAHWLSSGSRVRRFRAVFSFAPVHDVTDYGTEWVPFDFANREEGFIRGPSRWLDELKSATFVFEGTGRQGTSRHWRN